MKITQLSFIFLFAVPVLFCSCGSNTDAPDTSTDSTTSKKEAVLKDLKNAIDQTQLNQEFFTAYARQAREEKMLPLAIFFDAMGASEKIFQAELIKASIQLGRRVSAINEPSIEVKTSAENLANIAKIKEQERSVLFPKYILNATAAQSDDAELAFEMVLEVEKMLIPLYDAAINASKSQQWKELPASYSVCPKCGYTYDTKLLPESCEVCGTGKDKFTTFK